MVEDKEKHLFFPRVWLYARTSTKDHDVVDWQLSELADWAAQEGYRVVGRSYTPGFPVIRVGGMLRIPRDRLFDWMELQSLENTPNQNPKIVGI